MDSLAATIEGCKGNGTIDDKLALHECLLECATLLVRNKDGGNPDDKGFYVSKLKSSISFALTSLRDSSRPSQGLKKLISTLWVNLWTLSCSMSPAIDSEEASSFFGYLKDSLCNQDGKVVESFFASATPPNDAAKEEQNELTRCIRATLDARKHEMPPAIAILSAYHGVAGFDLPRVVSMLVPWLNCGSLVVNQRRQVERIITDIISKASNDKESMWESCAAGLNLTSLVKLRNRIGGDFVVNPQAEDRFCEAIIGRLLDIEDHEVFAAVAETYSFGSKLLEFLEKVAAKVEQGKIYEEKCLTVLIAKCPVEQKMLLTKLLVALWNEGGDAWKAHYKSVDRLTFLMMCMDISRRQGFEGGVERCIELAELGCESGLAEEVIKFWGIFDIIEASVSKDTWKIVSAGVRVDGTLEERLRTMFTSAFLLKIFKPEFTADVDDVVLGRDNRGLLDGGIRGILRFCSSEVVFGALTISFRMLADGGDNWQETAWTFSALLDHWVGKVRSFSVFSCSFFFLLREFFFFFSLFNMLNML